MNDTNMIQEVADVTDQYVDELYDVISCFCFYRQLTGFLLRSVYLKSLYVILRVILRNKSARHEH